MVLTKFIDEKFGSLEITLDDSIVTGISFIDGYRVSTPSNLLIFHEIEEYFNGNLQNFHSLAKQQGTEFQQKVWRALGDIPYGETRTYGEIASIIGSPGSSRAVGTACGKNRLPIIIPCHRVVGASGPGGFSAGLERKKMLLNIENQIHF